MEPEARYTLVGVVVVILIAMFAALIIWLHGSGDGGGTHRYKVYFEQQSLQGLQRQGEVTMRGVKVGSIASIRFARERGSVVEVVIAVDPNTPVRENTVAVVERNFLTGLATLQLVTSTDASPLLTSTPPGEPYPVIAEGQSTMQHLSQSLDQFGAHADDAVQSISATLSAENRAALKDILGHLRVASRHLDATLANADTAMTSITRAGDDLRASTSAIAADVHTLASRYEALGGEAALTVSEARGAMRRIVDDADRLAQRSDEFLVGTNDELRSTARSLRSAADSIGMAAGRLRNPQQAVFGPGEDALGPGEATQ